VAAVFQIRSDERESVGSRLNIRISLSAGFGELSYHGLWFPSEKQEDQILSARDLESQGLELVDSTMLRFSFDFTYLMAMVGVVKIRI
jgi:hypothetical protein